jgi:metal-sulfur cluster biosynthetic enzyme
MMEDRQVLEALSAVIDPEVGVNIVDLGLVHLLDSNPQRIYVGLIMTSPACPQGEHIRDQAQDAVARRAEGMAVDIELLDYPYWSPDRMSEAARRQLGWNG